MTNKSFYDSSIFTALREGRVGVQCERSLRLLLLLLDGWARHEGPRKPLYSKPDDGVLTTIYFDKFAMLVFRLWDALYKNTREAAKKQNDEETSITFPSPFTPIPGKHGPGPGRFDPEKVQEPTYLIDMLYALQNEGFLNYFEISPPSSDPGNYKNHKTTVTPGLPVTDEQEFLRGFTRLEQEILLDLRSALKRLGPSEIRALGTHATYDGTVADIEREFKYLGKEKPNVTDSLRANRLFRKGAQELFEFAEEALRKSKGNREDYRSGRHKMMTQVNHPALAKAFENSQGTTEQLWPHSPVVEDLVRRAEHALLATGYLTAVAEYKEYRSTEVRKISKRVTKAEKQIAQNSVSMKAVGIGDLPSLANEIFVGDTSQITEVVQAQLIGITNTL